LSQKFYEMEIVNKNVTFLTNCEVYQLLKPLAKTNINNSTNKLEQQSKTKDSNLPTIVYESLRYLEKTPCVDQSPQLIEDFLKKLDEKKNEFNLTKIEKLQLINQKPTNAVELQYIIEDSEERFTLEQMDDLLEFTITNLSSESNKTEVN
jgi:hypothetical protein